MSKPKITEEEKAIRRRLKEDFPFYAAKALKLNGKSVGTPFVPFKLNTAQRYLQQIADEQLREQGYVRILVPKARQLGASTYVQGRMLWKTIHTEGLKGYIVAHTDESTTNMFEMAKLYYEKLPQILQPPIDRSNAKELKFTDLFSGYKVATGGGRDIGRSGTIHFLHVSEAAYLPKGDETLSAVLDCVPPGAQGTEIWVESTSAGPQGKFWEMCQEHKDGKGEYRVAFLPWFLDPDYVAPVPVGFELEKEEVEYAEMVLAEAGHVLTPGQVMFRRRKISEKKSYQKWRGEYPATLEEAFTVDISGSLWTEDVLDRGRRERLNEDVSLTSLVVAVDPSGGKKKRNDEQGIIVAGKGTDQHYYVLEDLSGKYSPSEWGRLAVDAFRRWKADCVVAEQNFGGDMVKHVVCSCGLDETDYREVHASRSKAVRAEPIAALYEQGLVHHIGRPMLLENELVSWNPNSSTQSPNRLDALVWAIYALRETQRSLRAQYEV